MNISDLTPLLDILASLGSEESTHDVLLRFELAKKVKGEEPKPSEQGVVNQSKEREIKEKDEESQTKQSESTSSHYSNTDESTTNQSTTNQSTTNQSTTNQSTTNQSTTNQSTTNQSTTNQSTTNQPGESDEDQSSQNTNVSGTYTSIITLQQTKDELEKVRNELLQRRSNAQQAVEEVRAKIRAAENLQQKKTLDKKMDELLEENERMFQPAGKERQVGEREEILKKVAKDKLSDINREITNGDVLKSQTDGVSSNNSSLLSKLNVLPSTSWPERLELVKKFYPYVDIEHIKSFNSYLDGSLVRNVAFIVRAPLLFKIPITLGILNRNDSVALLEITSQNSTNSTNSSNVISTTTKTNPPLLVTLNTLSPLFASALTRNYIPNKKCNLVVYGLSLLAIEVQRRISFIYKLLRKYAEYAEPRFERIVQEEEIKDNVVLFATLKLVSSVKFVIKQRRVTLTWDVVVKEIATAECGARVNLHVEGHDIETLFTGLCEMYGEMEAFDTIVEQMGEKME